MRKLPRQYISNIIYTVVGQPFQAWIDERVNHRNEKRAEEGNMIINMDEDIARHFQQSTHISTIKGNSNHLMKVSHKFLRSISSA